MTLLERINRFPPFLCRLVARKKHGYALMSLREIAQRGSLSKDTVLRLSRLRSWDSVSNAVTEKFARACGVDLMHPKRHVEWMMQMKKMAWKGKEKLVAKLLNPTTTK